MFLESIETQFTMYSLTGFPSFVESERLEAEILAEADLAPVAASPAAGRRSPTTFHLAISDGAPLGIASSTVGPLAELPLGLALRAAGVDLDTEITLSGPTCELVSLSVDEDATRNTPGVTEALYRSFYRHAKESEAQSLVVGVDPWIFDILTEQYGIPFAILGPPLTLLDRELLAIGGDIAELEAGVRRNQPEFFAYLDLPYRRAVPTSV